MPSAVRVIDQAAEIVVDASGFSGNLSAADTDVQTALATIDGLSISGGTPGGNSGDIQYNNAGSFGGTTGTTWQNASPHVSIVSQNAAYIGLLVKAAVSQSVNIQEWQNSSAAVIAGIDERGVPFANAGTVASNVFIGDNTGRSAASGGDNNVAIGANALDALTTGTRNMALGGDTLTGCQGGSYNMAIGYNACRAITSGNYNVAIGVDAITQNQTSNYNVGIGWQTLKNTTAGQNIAIGARSGENLSSGAVNVFVGYAAGFRQTTASNLLIVDNQLRADTAAEAANAILYGTMAAASTSQSLAINAYLFLSTIKSGATQVAAGAAANELWKTASHATLPDNVVMIGV